MRKAVDSVGAVRLSPSPAAINLANPISRNLIALYAPGEDIGSAWSGQRNKVTNGLASTSPAGAPVYKESLSGIGAVFGGTTSHRYDSDTLAGLSGATAVTLFSVQANLTLGAYQNPLDQDDGATRRFQHRITNANKAELIRFDTGGAAYFATDATAVTSVEALRGFFLGSVTDGASMSVWMNDRKTTGTISNTPAGYTPTITVGLSRQFTQPLNATLLLWGAFLRALEDGEMRSLAANPWQLLAVRRKVTPSALAGAGGTAANSRWFLAA